MRIRKEVHRSFKEDASKKLSDKDDFPDQYFAEENSTMCHIGPTTATSFDLLLQMLHSF